MALFSFNTYLSFSTSYQTDPLHQYDGLVYPKLPESFFKRLFGGGGITGRIVDDMKTALNIFLPPIETIISTIKKQLPGETETAEALLQTVTDVFSGLSLQLIDVKNRVEIKQQVNVFRKWVDKCRLSLAAM